MVSEYLKKGRRVFLLGNGRRPGVLEGVERLQEQIEELYDIADVDFTGEKDLSNDFADFAIVFGGDGAILRAVRQLGRNQIPILAVNLGTLGFLASVSADELIPLLQRDDFESLPLNRQILLECTAWRPGPDGPVLIARKLVVNEVVVQGGPPFELLQIELFVDNELVTVYRGDGLMISTPVGSTAHNLASGGPILHKNLDAIVLAPMSPHTLSFRPVVDSADRLYEFRVRNREAYAVVDGDSSLRIAPGDRIVVRKANVSFTMIRIPERSYYRTLREKLGWNGSLEYIERKIERKAGQHDD